MPGVLNWVRRMAEVPMGRGVIARRFAAVVALVVAACSSGSTRSTSGPPIGWAPGVAEAANGPAGPVDVATVCGSSTDQFLAELLHHPATDLKVMEEWGDIAGGRQLLVSGTVATVFQGPGDLPMDHPLGDDLSMDVDLDAAFKPYSLQLGAAPSDTKPGQLHVEISSGLIPHLPSTSAPAAETWRQLSDVSLQGFQPGFDHPAVGDRVLVEGRYIVDCGHPDYHTELHPISFLAWSHQEGTTSVVHVYGNVYWDTELFNPDLSVGGKVNDQARDTDPNTKPLPKYLIDEVGRLIAGTTSRLRTFELLGVMPPAATSWQICAPAGTSGSHLLVQYDVRTRPGVTFTAAADPGTGCAAIQTSVANFSAPDVPLRTCVMPWDYLNSIAGKALSTTVDTRAIIKANVPANDAALVDQDPLTACADPLSGPPVADQPAGQSVHTDASQPFPIYGIITIQRR